MGCNPNLEQLHCFQWHHPRVVADAWCKQAIRLDLPRVDFPSCARTLVQCSEMFMITNGCKDTETLPVVPAEAMTLGPALSTSIFVAIVQKLLLSS